MLECAPPKILKYPLEGSKRLSFGLLRTLTIFLGLCVVVVAALVVLLGFGVRCGLFFGALVVGLFVVVVVVVVRRTG